MKTARNERYDPFNRVAGRCPLRSEVHFCTDISGDFHNILIETEAGNHTSIYNHFGSMEGWRVLRIEEVHDALDITPSHQEDIAKEGDKENATPVPMAITA